MSGFGTCPFCGHALSWSSDSEWCEDETKIVRYLSCSFCGASVEAIQCPEEEEKNFPFYH